MAEAQPVLGAAYRAFNAREVEAAIELMDPEVDWPNAWEGGRPPSGPRLLEQTVRRHLEQG